MARHRLAVTGERSEQILAWLVLLLLGTYTYLELITAPYLGFDFNPTNGEIQEVYVPSPLLRAGDKLHVVDDLLFADWAAALRIPLVGSARPGDDVILQVHREGQLRIVRWTIGGPT